MNIAFFSDYPNETQVPLSTALSDHPDIDQLTFVSLSGQGPLAEALPYPVLDGSTTEGHEAAVHLSRACDVALFGNLCGHEELLEERMAGDGLAFRISERLLAKGAMFRHVPPLSRRIEDRFLKYRDKSLYALCIGGSTAADLKLCGFPEEKCLDWAYFPTAGNRDFESESDSPRDTVELLWVAGRDEDQPPQMLLDAFSEVTARCENAMLHLVLWSRDDHPRDDLSGIEGRDTCAAHRMRSFEAARYLMESADVLVSTRGHGDGWDFGILPSLSAGCTVIARRDGDTASQLIEDSRNGILWDGTARNLAGVLEQVCHDDDLRHRIGDDARQSAAEWSVDRASDRLVTTAKALLAASFVPFTQGPCGVRTSTAFKDAGGRAMTYGP